MQWLRHSAPLTTPSSPCLRVAVARAQAYAAQELHAREWRYHTDNKLWFRRETEAGKPASSAAGGAVQWVYWDVGAWEKRVFTGAAATLAGGFLAEDEARVRVP